MTEHYHKWIPKTIKALRLANEMTLKDLSAKSGLSSSYLSDIEQGRTIPTLATLDKLLMAFGAILTLGTQEDYVPRGYVWVKRETLVKLSDLVKEITPRS